MNNRTLLTALIAAGFLLFLSLNTPAQALTITLTELTFDEPPRFTAEQMAVFRRAADYWEGVLEDPINVNIKIRKSGGIPDPELWPRTRIARTTHHFVFARGALLADTDTPLERSSVAALPEGALPMRVFGRSTEETKITMTTANAKALGLDATPIPFTTNWQYGTNADGLIKLTEYEVRALLDFDSSDGIPRGQTDAESLIRHEIAHILGFESVVIWRDTTESIGNPNTNHPKARMLDLWRFEQTGGAHDLTTERRMITYGPAEYYDGVLNNLPMSQGWHNYDDPFDPACVNTWQVCQASHWRDDQGLLMVATLPYGEVVDAADEDLHALDYIGYNRTLVTVTEAVDIVDLVWGSPYDIVTPVDGPWPPLPPPQETPEWATLSVAAGMQLGPLGTRSAAGFARFETSQSVEGDPPQESAPAFFDIVLNSDTHNGVPFRFSASCSVNGCGFDPVIGEFGGYRITGFLDAAGDEQEDIDARITLVMAADESGMPVPEARNVFHLDTGAADNGLIINDYDAFGIEPTSQMR